MLLHQRIIILLGINNTKVKKPATLGQSCHCGAIVWSMCDTMDKIFTPLKSLHTFYWHVLPNNEYKAREK